MSESTKISTGILRLSLGQCAILCGIVGNIAAVVHFADGLKSSIDVESAKREALEQKVIEEGESQQRIWSYISSHHQ